MGRDYQDTMLACPRLGADSPATHGADGCVRAVLKKKLIRDCPGSS